MAQSETELRPADSFHFLRLRRTHIARSARGARAPIEPGRGARKIGSGTRKVERTNSGSTERIFHFEPNGSILFHCQVERLLGLVAEFFFVGVPFAVVVQIPAVAVTEALRRGHAVHTGFV